MKNKLNKNNVFGSLNSAFEQFKETPPERVWDAVELDLAKKQLEKDKKRFFWIQFSSIFILIFFIFFGTYKFINYTNPLSDNSSKSKQSIKTADTAMLERQSLIYHQPTEITNVILDKNKNSAKNSKKILNKNTNEISVGLIQTQVKDSSDNKLVDGSISEMTNKTNKKNHSAKSLNKNKASVSSKPIVNVNIKKSSNSDIQQKDKDIIQTKDEVKKTDLFAQNDLKNVTTHETKINTDSSITVVEKNNLDSVITQNPDSSIVIANTIKLDTVNQSNNTPVVTQPSEKISRLSLMAFFSPDYSSRILMKGNNSMTSSYNKVETPMFAFKSGVKIGYDLSDKWSVQLGAMYSYIELKSTPTNLNIDSSTLDNIRYSYATSSGIVSFSSEDFKEDDAGSFSSNKIYSSYSAKEKIQFINIPALVKYRFLNKKTSAYFIGGITANFIISKQVKLDVLNEPGSLTVNTTKISGLRKMNGGLLLGVEWHYNFYKGFSVLLAPTATGSFTSINKNTVVKSYPFSIGLAAGLMYHF